MNVSQPAQLAKTPNRLTFLDPSSKDPFPLSNEWQLNSDVKEVPQRSSTKSGFLPTGSRPVLQQEIHKLAITCRKLVRRTAHMFKSVLSTYIDGGTVPRGEVKQTFI